MATRNRNTIDGVVAADDAGVLLGSDRVREHPTVHLCATRPIFVPVVGWCFHWGSLISATRKQRDSRQCRFKRDEGVSEIFIGKN